MTPSLVISIVALGFGCLVCGFNWGFYLGRRLK